jgi:FixJ family two-component response regulator
MDLKVRYVLDRDSMAPAPHIAIVDDDASIRAAICNLVGSIGYSADAFPTAEDFLQSEKLAEIDCAIVDMHMPGMSGLDLLRHVATEQLGIPVIVITAFPQEATREAALRYGALSYLTKPLHEECLVTCLEQAVPVTH